MEDFVSWFEAQHGTIDKTSMGITDIPGRGRGAIALRDIPEGHTLFTIPRNLTLSTRTSSLPSLFGDASWKRYGLNVGWVGLILCMMWEEAQGASSKWTGYLSILPSTFDTPMFWTPEELEELKGTAVVDKIGRDDAERDYHQKLVPAVKSRTDLFPEESLSRHYNIERYHIMGSRILSRSFNVEKWIGSEDEQQDDGEANTRLENAMDVDESLNAEETCSEPHEGNTNDHIEEHNDEDGEGEEEEEEDSSDVAMVPMADMLNARFESENAKLFYEERDLKMMTTKSIKAGEQIWNTYSDPPNSELLRKYGHVDLVPLQPPLSGQGNPEDVLEIRADLVVEAVSSRAGSNVDYQERVDWWLEFAEDDIFVAGTECEVPKEMISLAHLFLLPQVEWEKTRKKSKLPKPKFDSDVLPIIIDVFQRRLSEYPTTTPVDEELLEDTTLSLNKRNAVIVRLGEKRILDGILKQLHEMERSLNSKANDSKKRKTGDVEKKEESRYKRMKH